MLDRYKVPPHKHLSGLTPWLANLRTILGISTLYSAYSTAKSIANTANYYTHEKGKEPERRSEELQHYRFATQNRENRAITSKGIVFPLTPVEFYTYLSAQYILDNQQRTEGQPVDVSDIPQIAQYINDVLARTIIPRAKDAKDVQKIQDLFEYIGEASDYVMAVTVHNTTLTLAEAHHDNYKIGGMDPKTPGNVAGTVTGIATAAGLAAINPILALAAPFVAHKAKAIMLENRAVTVINDQGTGFEAVKYVKEKPEVADGLINSVNELLTLISPDWLTPEEQAKKGLFGRGPKIRKIESTERREAFQNAIIATLSPEKLYPLLRRAEFYAMRIQRLTF